jgi:hypothetical protein
VASSPRGPLTALLCQISFCTCICKTPGGRFNHCSKGQSMDEPQNRKQKAQSPPEPKQHPPRGNMPQRRVPSPAVETSSPLIFYVFYSYLSFPNHKTFMTYIPAKISQFQWPDRLRIRCGCAVLRAGRESFSWYRVSPLRGDLECRLNVLCSQQRCPDPSRRNNFRCRHVLAKWIVCGGQRNHETCVLHG